MLSLQALPKDIWLKKTAAPIGVSSHIVLCVLLYSFSMRCPTAKQSVMCTGNHPCCTCQYFLTGTFGLQYSGSSSKMAHMPGQAIAELLSLLCSQRED